MLADRFFSLLTMVATSAAMLLIYVACLQMRPGVEEHLIIWSPQGHRCYELYFDRHHVSFLVTGHWPSRQSLVHIVEERSFHHAFGTPVDPIAGTEHAVFSFGPLAIHKCQAQVYAFADGSVPL